MCIITSETVSCTAIHFPRSCQIEILQCKDKHTGEVGNDKLMRVEPEQSEGKYEMGEEC